MGKKQKTLKVSKNTRKATVINIIDKDDKIKKINDRKKIATRKGTKSKKSTIRKTIKEPKYSEKIVPVEDTETMKEIVYNKVIEDGNTFYVCDFKDCDFRTTKRVGIRNHSSARHNINVKWFQCTECDYKAKQLTVLKNHRSSIHNIDVKWFQCDMCEYRVKQSGSLKRHKRFVHNIDVKWFHCTICDFKAKQQSAIDIHMMHIHDIGVTMHECSYCDYTCKEKGRLTKHMQFNHDINTKYYFCDMDCDFKCKQMNNLINHKKRMHNINVTYTYCDIDGCDYKSKITGPSTLRMHKSELHNIDVVWHECDIDQCVYRAKRKKSLETHKANMHNINVTYFPCQEINCNYNPKQKGALTRHMSLIHDIGDEQCQLCLQNTYKTTSWTDPKTKKTHEICRKCFRKATGHETRIEKQIVEYLQENFKHPMIRQDQQVKGDACLNYRPDIMYACCATDLVIYVEIDEHEHKYSNGSYKCDEKRMSDLYDETPGKQVVFIRYNPHKYTVCDDDPYVESKNRRKLLLNVLNYTVKNYKKLKKKHLMNIFYICYSEDNEYIAKSIPNKLVYSKNDCL
jgi:hypothetical protein